MPRCKTRRFMVLRVDHSGRKIVKSTVNRINEFGDTALHSACSNGNYKLIQSILSLKPNLNIRNKSLCTPLIEFMRRPPENEVILTKLLEAGADPNIPDKKGNSPLHILASNIETNKTKIFARILVEYKANVNAKNIYEDTPLHIAVDEGSENLVEVLLDSGASINILDFIGRNAWESSWMDRFRYPRIYIRLTAHMIVLYCCGLSVNLQHLEEVCANELYSDFKKDCEEQIRQLKVTLVGDSTVSYYDILVCSTPVVARYLFNASILASLSEFDFSLSDFGYILMRKWKTASKHHHGIKIGIAAAAKIFPFLPHLCIDKLIEYLDIDDCINLDKACSFRTQILE